MQTILWKLIIILTIIFILSSILTFLIGFKFKNEKYKIIVMKILVWIVLLSLFSLSIIFLFIIKPNPC